LAWFNFLGKLVYTLECLKIGHPYLRHRLVINHQAQKAKPAKAGYKGGLPPFVLLARRFIVGRAFSRSVPRRGLFDGRKAAGWKACPTWDSLSRLSAGWKACPTRCPNEAKGRL